MNNLLLRVSTTVIFIYGTVHFTCIALSLVIAIDWQRKKNAYIICQKLLNYQL